MVAGVDGTISVWAKESRPSSILSPNREEILKHGNFSLESY